MSAALRFGAATTAPMPWTVFASTNPNDAKVRFGTVGTLADLERINEEVNAGISLREEKGDTWTLAPEEGDCDDFAVTKRHMLLEDGWPSAALLIATVQSAFGPHGVLVVRMPDGDHVLDCLTDTIRSPDQTGFRRWIKVQGPDNPNFWFEVSVQGRAACPATP